MDYINAFWVGGLICALVQILLDKTKLLPGRVMVLLVCTGAVLGSVGIYNKLMDFAGAGASVPLLGFGNLLWKGVKKPSVSRASSASSWEASHPAPWESPQPSFSPIWPALFLNQR